MGRLFLQLYSAFAIVVVIGFLGLFNLYSILQGPMEYYLSGTTRGTYALLEKRLQTLPEQQWPNLISDLNRSDGYPIRLLSIESLTFSPNMMERLNRGAIVFTQIDDAIHCYKRVLGSGWVLEFPFGQTEAEDVRRLSRSTFNLIEMRLRESSQNSWPAAMAEISKNFGFPVVLLEKNRIKLPSPQRSVLEDGKIVVQTSDDETQFIYRRVADSPYVIKMGPFDELLTDNYLNTFLVLALSFALLLAVAVLFRVFPLWRDLKRLVISTSTFGSGDLGTRAILSKRSVLHRLAESFNAMADRIQHLISSHKELTNAVSHELRTPLARLRFGMEMLQSSVDETDRMRYMASMNADIDELDHLVEELLTYARFDRDKPELKFRRQDIVSWLVEIIRQAEIGEDKLSISFENTGRYPEYAFFEPRLMARAVGNLLQNAKRYARTRVRVTFTQDDENHRIIIDDDGPGIPEDGREQIFEAFKRLDPSRDRGTGGYGLGLAIVQRICQWHEGTIKVGDSPLGGARFIIKWPRSESA